MPAHVHAGGAKRRAHTLLSTSLTHPWKPLRPMSADTPRSPRSTLYYPPSSPCPHRPERSPPFVPSPLPPPRPAPRRMPDSGPLRPFESPFPLCPSSTRPPLFPPSYSSSGPLDVLTVTDPTLPPPPPPHRTEWGGSRVEGEHRRGRRDERSRTGERARPSTEMKRENRPQ